MIKLKNLKVDTFDLNFLHVSWQIEDTDEDLAKYRFSVLRSGSPEGDFKTIREDLSNTFEIFDRTVNPHSKIRKFYYKIVTRNVETEETEETGPETISQSRGPDLILLEIRRRNEELLLPRFVGTRVAIFIEKTFGQRCHECFDKLKRRQKTSRCLACFNAGYVGGYFNQINGWINMSPIASVARIEEIGETHPSVSTFWTGHYPILKPRDIIVEETNRRWRVVDVNFTEKRRVEGHQVIRCTEVARGDIEHTIPVNEIVIPEDPSGFLGFYPPLGSGLL